ncbi:MAG: glycoside hydrolase family 97 protein [Bacteroides sp.]|nr:glycoside hydrolase family 97 protein [Bacteroides sp.]
MKRVVVYLCCLCSLVWLKAENTELFSPDEKIRIRFSVSETSSVSHPGVAEGTPYYEVWYDGEPFLLPSWLGFELVGSAELKHYFQIAEVKYDRQRSSWKPLYGERSEYPDSYNEMRIILEETLYPNRKIHILFRAYNEGIAFRYEIPAQPGLEKVVINREYTEFTFPRYAPVWESYGHEGKYYKVYPSEIKPDCELPLTCITASGIYGAIMEAGNHHYPRAYVEAPYRRENTIRIALRGEAKSTEGMVTAWRAITLSSTPGGLMEQNYLLLNLNEPCKIADTSWIKPGTAMRETVISTPEAYTMIDFCQRKGIDYMIFDWGWYGVANSHKNDPSYVNVTHPTTGEPIPGHPGLDLPAVIRYGREKGVGIFLYVNREGLERYADKIFPLFKEWGVKGIKPGFVQVGKQEWQEWMEMIVKKAAEYNLLVDIHDAYRPNGFSRTYPNLLTQEGIHGNEQNPNADHDVMLPFTRFTIGAGDYTPGYCRGDLQSTYAHRLALPVIYYSPAQFLFWREKISECHERPELELWEHLPIVWEDTRVLSGEIGEYIVVARRSGNSWYIGGITNTHARTIELDLSFLPAGYTYKATCYTDKDLFSGEVEIRRKPVRRIDKITFPLQPSGGFAVRITHE